VESLLQEKIETLRFEMIKQANMCGSLTLESVVSVSQQLDRYIVIYQKLKSKKLILKNKQFLYHSNHLVGSIRGTMDFHLLLTTKRSLFYSQPKQNRLIRRR
jgi:hypothetical protein